MRETGGRGIGWQLYAKLVDQCGADGTNGASS